jgi:hypothetical protein
VGMVRKCEHLNISLRVTTSSTAGIPLMLSLWQPPPLHPFSYAASAHGRLFARTASVAIVKVCG